MRRVLTTWIHDEDPFKLLAFEEPLNAIKARLVNDKRYFEKLIETHLLGNIHRSILRLTPDPEFGRRFDEDEKARLATIRASLNESQIAELVENTKKLKLRQETPDPAEALETLPVLKLQDLEKESRNIPIEVLNIQGTQALYHDLFTNGIVYLDLGFDLHTLPKELTTASGL